ncbi:MAG: lipid-A-disaccharide synthase [Burkholderiaceae bacterium]|nr:lipid-A-disaccharide synthase [Burkholderiaceae bacterium]
MNGRASLRVAIVAGEKSGDMLGADVVRGLRARCPELQVVGMAGPAMIAAGVEPWWSIEDLSVHGFTDVLRQYPRLHRLRESLKSRLRDWRPDVFLGVDAPDFNLGVETALRAAGIRTVHFVSPSIWAWRGGRINAIRRAVDHMLLVFPFEQRIYDAARIPATYVGHPLADHLPGDLHRDTARRRLGVDPSALVVALLPGSRRAEVREIGPCFIATAAWLRAHRPAVRFLLPSSNEATLSIMEAMIGATPATEGLGITVLQGHSHEAMAAADAVLVASGTATLEVALFRRPMVIAYRLGAINYQIMKRLAYQKHIGLPNILCGETVVPEFVQDAATPEHMGPALLRMLEDRALQARLHTRFDELGSSLRLGCAERAADAILATLSSGSAQGVQS